MSLTDDQAKYYAHELTRRFPPDIVEKVTVAFAGAQVDLNPHQIDAALFDARDEVDHQLEKLIATIEGKLRQQTCTKLLFTIA